MTNESDNGNELSWESFKNPNQQKKKEHSEREDMQEVEERNYEDSEETEEHRIFRIKSVDIMENYHPSSDGEGLEIYEEVTETEERTQGFECICGEVQMSEEEARTHLNVSENDN